MGIVTGAVLELFRKPRALEAAFVGLKSPADALKLLAISQAEAAGSLTSFELLAEICVDMSVRQGTDIRDPLQNRPPWYVLIAVAATRDTEDAMLQWTQGGVVRHARVVHSERAATQG